MKDNNRNIISTPPKQNLDKDDKDNENNNLELDKDKNGDNVIPNPIPNDNEKTETINLNNAQQQEVVDVLEINKKIPVSLNIKNITNKSKDMIKITKIEILSFSDSRGILILSILGTYKNKKFLLNNYEISGFNNYSFMQNSRAITVSINKERLIKTKKEIADLFAIKGEELLTYININVNGILLNHLFDEKLIEVENINLGQNKSLTFSLYYINKSKTLNEDVKIENKIKIDGIRIPITDDKITEIDVLNYILDKKIQVKVKDNEDNKIFASFYENRSKIVNNAIVAKFFDLDETKGLDYFKNKTGQLFIQIEKVKANDINGILFVSYHIILEVNDQMKRSKTKNIEIKNFPKAESDKDLNSQFILIENRFIDGKNSFQERIKKLYDKVKNENDLTNLEITDKTNLLTFLGFSNEWNILRKTDNSSQNKYIVNDARSYWEFQFKGTKLSDLLDTNTGILIDPETRKEKISFYSIQIKPIKISNFEINKIEESLTAKFTYEIKFYVYYANNVDSNNTKEISLIKENTISWKQKTLGYYPSFFINIKFLQVFNFK
ncbi:hypothetical protein DA803_00995 [[Mycoplasma] phocae]|uniref:Uncharacterized protein n=1 Tax=[Mycoplasma] phocae TaxID=142651 RepID=A0A2Z5ISG2_9BACT|nr:hypothetical protein [[Mycoplasma] phocae]AXE60668.1 hypothetical protein DA803_00995 [[Mycoplasma] phocae]